LAAAAWCFPGAARCFFCLYTVALIGGVPFLVGFAILMLALKAGR
jgi:hypothetical protein